MVDDNSLILSLDLAMERELSSSSGFTTKNPSIDHLPNISVGSKRQYISFLVKGDWLFRRQCKVAFLDRLEKQTEFHNLNYLILPRSNKKKKKRKKEIIKRI